MHFNLKNSSFKSLEFHNFNDRLRSAEVRRNKTVLNKNSSELSSYNHLFPKNYELKMRYLKPNKSLNDITQLRRTRFGLCLDSRPCHAIKAISALVLRRCEDLSLNLFFHNQTLNLSALKRVCRLSKNVRSTRILSRRENCPKQMAFVFHYLPTSSNKFQIQPVRPYSTCLLTNPSKRSHLAFDPLSVFQISEDMKYILNFAPPFNTGKLTSFSAFRLKNLTSLCITPSFTNHEENGKALKKFWHVLSSISSLETLCIEIIDNFDYFGNFDILRDCLWSLRQLKILKLNFGNKSFEWYRFMKNCHKLSEIIQSQSLKLDLKIELSEDFYENAIEYSEQIFEFMPEPSENKFKLEFILKEELNAFDPVEYICFAVRNEWMEGIKTTSIHAYTKGCSQFHHRALSFGSKVSYLRLEERYNTHLFPSFSDCLSQYAFNLTHVKKIALTINLSEAKFHANDQIAFKQLIKTISLLKSVENIEFFFLDEFLPESVLLNFNDETPLRIIQSAFGELKSLREITFSFGGYLRLGLAHVEDMFVKSDELKTVNISLRNFKRLSTSELDYLKNKIDLKLEAKNTSLNVVTFDNQKISASATLEKLDYRPLRIIFHSIKNIEGNL